jgi:hypothetical protein
MAANTPDSGLCDCDGNICQWNVEDGNDSCGSIQYTDKEPDVVVTNYPGRTGQFVCQKKTGITSKQFWNKTNGCLGSRKFLVDSITGLPTDNTMSVGPLTTNDLNTFQGCMNKAGVC